MIIAQITDLHIKPEGRLAYAKVDTAPYLQKAVDHLNALDPRPDVVLATGDLVDAGSPAEYARLREILAGLAMPFFLVPGNHDSRAALRAAFPDHGWMGRDGFIHYAIEDFPVRLIGLDTTQPGLESGVFCPARAAWLREALARSDRPAVLFMHHPPFRTGMAYHDSRRLEGRDLLAAAIAPHSRVVWALCGHLHRNMTVGWNGVPMSAVSGTAHQAMLDLRPEATLMFTMEPPACQLLLWDEAEGMIGHVSAIGSFDGPHPFYKDGRLID